MSETHRLTTREAAKQLSLEYEDSKALALLQAAHIPHTRCGSGYLWDGPAVAKLAVALGSNSEQAKASAPKARGARRG